MKTKLTLSGFKHRLCISGAALGLLSACNGEFGVVIPDREYNDSVSVISGAPKVLFIIADGARGESVRDARTATISSLITNSIYSWNALSDEESPGDVSNWADMLTGVGKNKHGIITGDFSEADLAAYPTLFTRIKQHDPAMKSVSLSTASEFNEQFAVDADVQATLQSDEAVKEAAIDRLTNDTASFITAHFKDIDRAGRAGTYDLSDAGYANAIATFDSQLGEMINAVNTRNETGDENWLVVIASNRGGTYDLPDELNDNTIFSNPEVNSFVIFYSPRYDPRFLSKPFVGSRYQGEFVRFHGTRRAEVTAGDNSYYNLGTAEFTIELKVKKNIGPNNNFRYRNPALLGKRPEWNSDGSTNGWVVYLEDNFWRFGGRGTGGGSQIRGGTLSNATWNSLAIVGVIRDGERYVRTYTNGVFNTETNINSWGDMDTDALMTIGYMNGNQNVPDAYIADVRVWKTAMNDGDIDRFSCETYIDPNHPYYEHLVGYWPVAGDADTTITDEGPFGSHMTFRGGEAEWERLNEFICVPPAETLGALVPRNVDLATQVISWLRIPRQERWQLDGRVWLDQ